MVVFHYAVQGGSKSCRVTIQMKAMEQYLKVALFVHSVKGISNYFKASG